MTSMEKYKLTKVMNELFRKNFPKFASYSILEP
jgi:hypothetical protein